MIGNIKEINDFLIFQFYEYISFKHVLKILDKFKIN